MAKVAALPMYDWQEVRQETDAEWDLLRKALLSLGIEAPEKLARTNADLSPVPGGIRSADGDEIAPDPAQLDPADFDFYTLWRHPDLVFAQTCWGPLELGLAEHVTVVGQPDYSAFEGGRDIFYRSAILMRRSSSGSDISVPDDNGPAFDVADLRDRRFAYNGDDSMSGIIALRRDLVSGGAIQHEADFDRFWSQTAVSGGHRQSVIEVAEGRADVATIDCRTLDLCGRFEPAIKELRIAGWTAERKGLPYIAAKSMDYAINCSSNG
ncbi:MAG: phosphate/phosphite/phosphonate ABC transporter substrate-binding protein [Rhizobiaceae bacterium]